jgi:hypothetical protein
LEGFQPTPRAQTPAVARFQASEPELRSWRDEVIPSADRKVQESLRDLGAHHVAAMVVVVGVAAAITVVTGEGVKGARQQWGAQNVEGLISHGRLWDFGVVLRVKVRSWLL